MFDKRFNNISDSIKKLAKFLAGICVIGGAIVAIAGMLKYLSNADYLEYASIYGGAGYGHEILTEAGNTAYTGLQLVKYGLICGVCGFLSTWPLYGFGELIEKVSAIADNQGSGKNTNTTI